MRGRRGSPLRLSIMPFDGGASTGMVESDPESGQRLRTHILSTGSPASIVMSESLPPAVRLTPELQAEYQQIYNDPAKSGSAAWHIAAKGLLAAGVIQAIPEEAGFQDGVEIADSKTDQQTL